MTMVSRRQSRSQTHSSAE